MAALKVVTTEGGAIIGTVFQNRNGSAIACVLGTDRQHTATGVEAAEQWLRIVYASSRS